MQHDNSRDPAVQIMALLERQLHESGPVLMQDLWNRYSAIGARELRDGVRMLIESEQLTMQVGPAGPQLALKRPADRAA